MFSPRWTLTCLLVLLVTPPPSPAQDKEGDAFPRIGFIRGDYIFAANRKRFEKTEAEEIAVLRAPFLGNKPVRQKRVYYGQNETSTPFLCHFSDNRCWCVADQANDHAVGVDSVDLNVFNLGDKEWKKGELKLNYRPDFSKEKPTPKDYKGWGLEPVRDVALAQVREETEDPDYVGRPWAQVYPPGIHFDILPLGPEKLLCFVLRKKTIRVWDGSRPPPKERADDEETVEGAPVWTERKDDSFLVDFKEPFTVFGTESTYYLLTQSGKLYISRKPACKEERKAEVLWKDAHSPIRAVIGDAANGKYYFFTRPEKDDGKEGKSVYFEMAAKVETTAFELKGLEGVKVDKPLRTVMEYAQVLVKDKKIKTPKE